MRLNSWRGTLAALVGVTLLSCVDSVTAPKPRIIGGLSADLGVATAPKVVISQIYGGGGNANAVFQNDYVELFNAGTASATLTGWSLQYASATGAGNFGGTSSQLVALSGSIAPGQYYLIKLKSTAAVGSPLPTADATNLNLDMAGASGKVALVDQPASLGCNGGSTPCSAATAAHIVDLVGYGAANYFEGAATPALSALLADFRLEHGCTDTNNNFADFATSTPTPPRNSSTTPAPCTIIVEPPPPPALDHIVITGGTSVNVGTEITLSAELQDATNRTIEDASATFAWESADDETVRIVSTTGKTATIRGRQPGGPITITVTGTSNGETKVATSTVTVIGTATIVPSTTFVSEVHYDNSGTDADEKIEIEGDALTSLDGWSLVMYNGSPGSLTLGVYATIPLTGSIPATCGARGVVVINFPVNGIQNGEADGWALINAQGQVTELKSYEGTFTATGGPAAGLPSAAIGADESAAPTAGRSVQRAGNGVWFGPRRNTFGACNQPLPPPPQGVNVARGKTELALAMQTQFAGLDPSGDPIASLVWSTSNPAIITVDQNGVVTAKGLGEADLTATAPDGAIGTAEMTVYLAAGSTGIRLGHNTEFGEPTDANPSDDFLIRRPQYTVSYNPQRGGANWVSWNLDVTHIGDNGRCPGTCYSADTAISNAGLPAYTTADWVSGAIWDRGHMAPSADWTSSEADNNTTFFLSNFLPQHPDLNQGRWEKLEEALRDSVKSGREAYIIAGGIFANGVGLGTIQNLGKIAIPDSTWKIAVITPAGTGLNADGTLPANTTVMAVNMPNVAQPRDTNWQMYLTTIDKIERSTGYDFLALLADAVECHVEGNCAPTAHITNDISGQVNEGQTVEFSGATSTDPDEGDVLTMAWTVNGTNAGTGQVLQVTFADDGVYAIRLTVTDHDGATSVTSSNVTVQNVAPAIAAFAGAMILRGETYTATGNFSDPGADSWTGLVNYNDGSGTSALPLSGKSFTLSHAYTSAGSFAVTVSVSDGTVTTTRSATVVVKTADQAIASLDAMVASLSPQLNKGQVNSLQVKLQAAAKQLQAGNSTPAVNILEAFVEEIQATIQSGRISKPVGTPLMAYAQRVIASITAP
jgi:DNA/RNA endonuclease G (NUC1)